jgi:mono/diheme cytochrome c family protein
MVSSLTKTSALPINLPRRPPSPRRPTPTRSPATPAAGPLTPRRQADVASGKALLPVPAPPSRLGCSSASSAMSGAPTSSTFTAPSQRAPAYPSPRSRHAGSALSLPPCSECHTTGTQCSCCKSLFGSAVSAVRISRLEAEVAQQEEENRRTRDQLALATREIAAMKAMLQEKLGKAPDTRSRASHAPTTTTKGPTTIVE